ncbi:MAG: chemotaxis protein CheR [Magnetococcus sp. DMHC-6]
MMQFGRSENDFNANTTISDTEFRRLSDFVYTQSGIVIPVGKKNQLTTRLQKRVRIAGLRSFSEYVDLLLNSDTTESEWVHFLDLVTSQKSDFFYEPAHFEYLAQYVLPEMIKNYGSGVQRPFMIWSAGCGAGEESFTLAMVLQEFKEHFPGINFRAQILATDISLKSLECGREAIYDVDRIKNVPIQLKQKYLLRSKDRKKQLVRVSPELRDLVSFRRLNFMERDFGLREKMDVIFCRNVIKYFDPATQEQLINKCCQYLMPNGYLFVGRSDSLEELHVPVFQVAPAIYKMISS